jgi:hypothetical protein
MTLGASIERSSIIAATSISLPTTSTSTISTESYSIATRGRIERDTTTIGCSGNSYYLDEDKTEEV